MPRPTHLFTDADRASIEDAIFDAEQKTGAEIVVVVAARSGGYARVADVFGLSVAVAVTLVAMWIFGDPKGEWIFPRETHMHPGLILGLLILVFAVCTAVADTNPAIVRLAAGKKRLRRHVERMGPSWFQRLRVRSTKDQVGVLIFVSLFEKMVMIVPDDAVERVLATGELDSVRDTIREGLRTNRLPNALREAITQAGEILSPHLPTPLPNMDELPNELHLID
ncbi:MAG: TPM domain-containing protein [Phycisphaerales bacterium]